MVRGPCSDAGQGRAGGTDTGDAQQVALPWEAELGKLEGIAQLHQTRELIPFFTPFSHSHIPQGKHWGVKNRTYWYCNKKSK